MKDFLLSEKPMLVLAVIFSIAIIVFNVFDINIDKNKKYAYSSQETRSYEVSMVNINTADIEEFTTLPNIGEETAKRIIEYRNKNGAFKTIEELKNVSGISERVYLELCTKITVQ